MFLNLSIQNRGSGLTSLEVLKDNSEKVAEATFFDRSDHDDVVTSNGTVYYRETLTEDASFEFRVRLVNAGELNDKIHIDNMQTSVRIYNNPPKLDVTNGHINCCAL